MEAYPFRNQYFVNKHLMELHHVFSKLEVPFLVFVNKRDLAESMTVAPILDKLDLDQLGYDLTFSASKQTKIQTAIICFFL